MKIALVVDSIFDFDATTLSKVLRTAGHFQDQTNCLPISIVSLVNK